MFLSNSTISHPKLIEKEYGPIRKTYLNFPPNLGEIVEALARQVEELAVLVVCVVGAALGLEELENERAARADVGTPGEEIAAHKGLEDA